MRFALLAALVLPVLAGYEGGDSRPEGPPGRLPSRLNGLAGLGANAASGTAVAVRCPSWLSRGAWGGRALRDAKCEYLFDLNRRANASVEAQRIEHLE